MLAKKWWVMIGTGMAALFITVDFTIVNTVLAVIQASLHASMSQLQWTMAGFGIGFCTFQVTMGRVADLIGRRLIFNIAVIGFGLSSLGAGLSPTINILIIFRIAQGVFGALIFPSGMAIVADEFPQAEQGKAMGMFGSLCGIGLAIGPVLGGLITHYFSWRMIFLINIPIVIVCLIICALTVRESKVSQSLPIDWWGFILITIFISAFTFAMNEGNSYGWTSLVILSIFAVSILSLTATIIVEKRVKQPLIPPGLFSQPGFIVSVIINSLALGSNWTILFIIPLYLHTILNYSSAVVGLMLLPMTAMVVFVPSIAGIIYDRFGSKYIVLFTFLSLTASMIAQLFFGATVAMSILIFAFIAYGIPWGVGNGIGIPLAFAHLKTTEDAGVITGALLTLFNLAGLLMFTIEFAVFNLVEKSSVLNSFQAAHIQLTAVQENSLKAALSDPANLNQVLQQYHLGDSQIITNMFKQAFIHGYHAMIILLLMLIGLGFITYLRVSNNKSEKLR